jgi:hypothetical protein
MTITFVDAGVLIAAARGRGEVSAQAMAILDDPDRSFRLQRIHPPRSSAEARLQSEIRRGRILR